MQELKEKINQSGRTLKEIATAAGCTPQHLSAVLCGRARLTEKLKIRIDAVLQEIAFSSPVYITLSLPYAKWRVYMNEFPKDIDIEETLKEYLNWLFLRFGLENMPPSEKEKYIEEEKKEGFNPYDLPLFVHLKRKAGAPLRTIDVSLPAPLQE